MTPQQLLASWRKELAKMYRWRRFNSGVDCVRYAGECTQFAKCIRDLAECLNPKPTLITKSLFEQHLEIKNDRANRG